MADPNPIPDFYQNHHAFLELADKVISDVSFVRISYNQNMDNPSGRLTEFLGNGVKHVTTNCLLEDVMRMVGERAIFPYDEVLACLHGIHPVTSDECLRSLFGMYNSAKLVLASGEHGADYVEQVRGLPVVVPAEGEAMGFHAPSESQLAYAATNDVVADAALEKDWMLQRKENLRQRAVKKGYR